MPELTLLNIYSLFSFIDERPVTERQSCPHRQTMYAVLGTSHTLVTLLLVHFITGLLYFMEGIGYEEVCQTFLLNPKVFLLCAESLTLSLGRTGYTCVVEFCMRLLLLCCLWKGLPAFWLI